MSESRTVTAHEIFNKNVNENREKELIAEGVAAEVKTSKRSEPKQEG